MDFRIPFISYLNEHRTKGAALFHAIRDGIVSGGIPYGMQLPSSRELAALYELSRGTVNTVYEMLTAEGYVVPEIGRGTFAMYKGAVGEAVPSQQSDVPTSSWGLRVHALERMDSSRVGAAYEDEGGIDFSFGRLDMSRFPSELWKRCLHAEVRDLAVQEDERWAAGDPGLRTAIAAYLRRARGIEASADDIVIVGGSMQAIGLLAAITIEPGDEAVVENPAYRGIRRAVSAAGGIARPADVDEKGIVPHDWQTRVLFVTPSRQFPTGAVLPLERRLQLLEWASRRQAVIVEDDYDSEFRYRGRPIEPLKALDREGRVVYVGSFSKTMPAAVRVGYAVLPPALRTHFLRAKELFEPTSTGLLEQKALAAFLTSGEYGRHLRRMRRLYQGRFALLVSLFGERLEELFELAPSDAGLHLFARWRRSVAEWNAFSTACAQTGVRFTDGSVYYAASPVRSGCFGFSHLTEDDIREGVRRLEVAWELVKGSAPVR